MIRIGSGERGGHNRHTAFLAGPPLIGFLGDEVRILKALTVTAGPLAIPRRRGPDHQAAGGLTANQRIDHS